MTTAVPRCQVLPEHDHSFSFRIDGKEVTRWHADREYPRPYFYPVNGPSGESLTRMGHPGAPNHDHHQSVWFAHNKVLGIDFWGNQSGATIRQLEWLALEDHDEACRMAMDLGWFDGHNPAPLLRQQLVCEVKPVGDNREFTLEVQSRFIPESHSLEFQQTNFGFFAVRVAKSISGHFGGGQITNSEGAVGEKAIFGKPALWVDYTGNMGRQNNQLEGITCFDHPTNPGQPTGWHVREDGWFCASPTMNAALETTKQQQLTLRYQLFIHSGPVNSKRWGEMKNHFAESRAFLVQKANRPHVMWEIVREKGLPA